MFGLFRGCKSYYPAPPLLQFTVKLPDGEARMFRAHTFEIEHGSLMLFAWRDLGSIAVPPSRYLVVAFAPGFWKEVHRESSAR